MIRRCLQLVAASCAVALAACTSIARPTVTQLTPSPPIFMVAYPLTFATGLNDQYRMEVPRGFITDLASIPRLLWWWQGPHEGTMAPAILHDFLYWEQPCTKDEADAAMYVAMKQAGMSDFSANRTYDGIRTSFAQDAWDKNKTARSGGEPRFFSDAYSDRLIMSSIEPTATLVSIQTAALKAKGVAAPRLPIEAIRSTCKAALIEFKALRNL